MIGENAALGAAAAAAMTMGGGLHDPVVAPHFTYHVECVGADGQVKWTETVENLVTTVGKNDLLDKYFKGSAYSATWFLGLKGTGTAVVGDTAASHASWAEVTPYTGNRPALAWAGNASAGSNAATAIAFAITLAGPTTVAGAFVQSVNTGTTGILYSAGDFSVSRSVVAGDTLNVTLTVSAT